MVKTIHELILEVSPYYKKKGGAETTHTLVYDSASEQLEPIYFFILELMGQFGLKTEKYSDSFTSSPGSGHFGELGQRATVMQQQGSKILGDINTVLRSVLNIVYDLKDFRMRLNHYEGLNSKDKSIAESAKLALKQIWMDKVDIQKGNSSIKAMALGQSGFVMLIDAFLVAKDEKDIDKLDLNDRIKRILKPRLIEFNSWMEQSEKELKKRYELERNYLKSQVSSLKLYSRWVKPYLKASTQLEQKEQGRNPDLVKTFNTILLELTLLGKSEIDLKSESLEGNLPEEFSRERFLKKQKRKYYTCVLVDFYFRGIPQRINQQSHYAFGGKTEVTFRAYSLNDDELNKLSKEAEKADLGDVFELIEGVSGESLTNLQEEINMFLDEKDKEDKKTKPKDESNPFLALIGKYDKNEEPKKEKKTDENKEIEKDSWIESEIIRPYVGEKSAKLAFDLFDVYKKAHGMPSYT